MSFVYDGTFTKTWEFLCAIFLDLKPILQLPNSENLELILEQITSNSPYGSENNYWIDLYPRIYSSNL